MTPQEFKAWFDGFTEGMDRAPTAKQWERIKKRVKDIDNTPTTERIFIDRYWPTYPRYAPYYGPIWTSAGYIYSANGQSAALNATASPPLANMQSYSANTAMYLLGRNDAAQMAATA